MRKERYEWNNSKLKQAWTGDFWIIQSVHLRYKIKNVETLTLFSEEQTIFLSLNDFMKPVPLPKQQIENESIKVTKLT